MVQSGPSGCDGHNRICSDRRCRSACRIWCTTRERSRRVIVGGRVDGAGTRQTRDVVPHVEWRECQQLVGGLPQEVATSGNPLQHGQVHRGDQRRQLVRVQFRGHQHIPVRREPVTSPAFHRRSVRHRRPAADAGPGRWSFDTHRVDRPVGPHCIRSPTGDGAESAGRAHGGPGREKGSRTAPFRRDGQTRPPFWQHARRDGNGNWVPWVSRRSR